MRMLEFNHITLISLHISNVFLAIFSKMNNLLPLFRKLSFP